MGPQGKSRGPHGQITWAPRGNHVGPQGKSRGPHGENTWAPRGNHVEELKQKMAEHSGAAAFFTGDGIDAYGDIIKDIMPEKSYVFAEEDLRYQHAESVARIALKKAVAGNILTYSELMPEYMRLAEAEQRLRAGTLSGSLSMWGRHCATKRRAARAANGTIWPRDFPWGPT